MTKGHSLSAATLPVFAVTTMFYVIVYMVLMLIPFYAQEIGLDASQIGVVMGVTMLASMLTRPFAGIAVDRWGPSIMMLLALLVFAISLPGYFFPGFWMFGFLRFTQGVVAGVFSTAMEIATIRLVPDHLRGQGLSLYSLATILPTTFGPALALYLKDKWPMDYLFFGLVLLGVATFACSIPIARRLGHSTSSLASRHAHEPGAWKQPALLWASSIMLLVSVANGAIFTFLPLHLQSRNIDFATIYFLTQTAILAVCRFVGRSWIPSNGECPWRLVAGLTILSTLGAGLLADADSLPILLVAACLNGFAFALLYPSLLTYVSFVVPAGSRAFLLALFIAAADFGFALGALVMGPLADSFSYSSMYWVCAGASLLAVAITSIARHQEAKFSST